MYPARIVTEMDPKTEHLFPPVLPAMAPVW